MSKRLRDKEAWIATAKGELAYEKEHPEYIEERLAELRRIREEKIDGSVEVYTTPNTGNGPWNKGYQPSGIQDPIRAAAFELVESVEKYIRQEELRSQLLIKKENLKKLL